MADLGGISEKAWDQVMCAGAGALGLIAIIGLCRAFASREFCRHVLGRCATSLCGSASAMDESDEVRQIVEDKLLHQKVQLFRIMLQAFSFLLLPSSFGIVLNVLGGRSRGYTWSQDVLHCLSHLVSILGLYAPGLVTARTLDMFFCGMMVLVSGYITPFTAKAEMLTAILVVTNFAVFILSCVRRTVRRFDLPFIGSNLLFCGCATSTVWVHADATCLGAQYTSVKYGFLFAEVSLVSIVMLLASWAEKGMANTMASHLQYQETKELHNAACALLRSCCEVVVELDRDGVILTPAQDLGSFLLRGVSQRLQGRRLADLISDEVDRQQFLHRLGASKLQDLGLAENLPVHTRDGNNHMLHLELLWFQFRRLDGQLRYMVGVREFADCSRDAKDQNQWQGVRECATRDASTPSEDSFALPETTLMRDVLANPAIAVVDCTQDGFPIQHLSSGFSARIGRPVLGSGLLDLMTNPFKFENWVQACVNDLLNEVNPPDQQFTLRMPQGLIRASCKVTRAASATSQELEDEESMETAFDFEHLSIHFTEIRQSHAECLQRPNNGRRALKKRQEKPQNERPYSPPSLNKVMRL